MALSRGDRIDRFTIEALLGQGGMGAVYRALDPRLGRRVAIKLLDGLASDAQARARFDREARLIAALDHPAAVHVYEAGEASGTPYIAMELVDGVTLRVAAAQEPSWRVRVGWLVEVASALAAAHDAGLVHRDVKPDNVMVRKDGRVKVLDFGIARRLRVDGDTVEARVTADGTIIGTPRYMAPEQLRDEPLDGRADQFAWGVTAYEVLCGSSPWGTTEEAIALISHVLGTTPPPLREVVPDLPAEVADVVSRAMAKAKDARFPTMHGVVAALTQAIGAPVPTPPSQPVGVDVTGKTAEAPAARTPGHVTPEALAPTVAAPSASSPVVPPRRRRGIALMLGFVAILAGAGWAARRARAVASAQGPVASATASAAPAPVSTNAEAARVYAEATETWRTDSMHDGARGWQHALQLDPGLCEAQVRIAALAEMPDGKWSAFEAANRCAGRLSARDRALLDAVAPEYATPVDAAEVAAAAERAVVAYPDDPEILYVGALRSSREDDARVALLDRVIAVDPHFVPAYAVKAELLAGMGRDTDAAATLRACQIASPDSVRCTSAAYTMAIAAGRCADAETLARHFIAQHPSRSQGYEWLGRALLGEGAAREAIETAFEQGASRNPNADTTGGLARTLRTLTGGDFAVFLALADAAEKNQAGLEPLPVRASWVTLRTRALLEMGQTGDARSTLAAFLKQSAAFAPVSSTDLLEALELAVALGVAPVSRLLAVAGSTNFAGKAHPTAAEQWVAVYVYDDPSPTMARDAVSKMPSAPELEALRAELSKRGDSANLAAAGITLARAGHADLAIPWLQQGVKPCLRYQILFIRMHAELELGKALAAAGDNAGAREAFETILRYWGEAKPRSVTADEARRRLAALGG
jgi:serine/threonine-protein kinase